MRPKRTRGWVQRVIKRLLLPCLVLFVLSLLALVPCRISRKPKARLAHIAALYTTIDITAGDKVLAASTNYLLSAARTLQSLNFTIEILVPSRRQCIGGLEQLRTAASTLQIALDYGRLVLSVAERRGSQLISTPRVKYLLFLAMGAEFPRLFGIGKNLNLFYLMPANPGNEVVPTVLDDDVEHRARILSSYDYILLDGVLRRDFFIKSIVQELELMLRISKPVPVLKILDAPTQTDPKNFHDKFQLIVDRGLAGQTFKTFTVDSIQAYRTLPLAEQTAAPVSSKDKVVEFAAVIVETSTHWAFEYVCRNVLFYLGSKWALMVLHGESNAAFVRLALKGLANVHFMQLPALDSLRAVEAYNSMLKTSEFWDSIFAQKVLFFQTDSVLLHGAIQRFIVYDYIGAPWDPVNNARVAKALHDGTLNSTVGNGGLSLRTVSAMRKAVRLYGSQSPIDEQEDMFFARNLPKLGFRVGELSDALNFCMEVDLNPGGFVMAVHAPWFYMPKHRYIKLLKSSIPGNKVTRYLGLQ